MAKEDLSPGTRQTIEDTLAAHDIVVYMKGTASLPQDGFSARMVEVVKKTGVDFHVVNVLTDPVIRQGIKDFSDWPTIPQLYHKGQFIGGSDVVAEKYQSGELQKLLSEAKG
ncbi:Grx4 family monothiol glutaredoxin [Streptomyces sp. NPDC007100]|uniref:Grx4 family monothiol glutaredoxin n=1 Tax=unclassified Streptomyces TaxID=2593676 RepID=UPI0033FDB740